MADLEEAVRLGREAIDATPLDPPDRAGWLNNLGNHLGNRYSRTGAVAELATQCFMPALHQSISPVHIRITTGRRLVFPAIFQHEQAYTIAKTAINLIPLLTPRSLQNTD